ncbi:MAG: hypothetical protein K6E83_00145 [Clostridium sp.]|nr:hypothetical protein [Clostridium sp.]
MKQNSDKRKPVFGKLFVLAVLAAAFFLFHGCQTAGTPPVESSAESGGQDDAGEGAQMTLLVYMIGSDLESLNGSASSDISEMIAASPGKHVRVFVETGGAEKWQDYGISNRTIQRYELSAKGPTLIEEQENVCMSDADTLSEFLVWGREYSPTERTGVILWNHGGGSVLGYGQDELYPESMLSLTGIQEAFRKAGGHYEFIGFDACLMATIETCCMLSDYADYLIASEETEPGDGWYYTEWLGKLEKNPGLSIEDLGKLITADFLAQSEEYPYDTYTLAMIRLDKTGPLLEKLHEFHSDAAERVRKGEYGTFAEARVKSKSFGGGRFEQIDVLDYMKLVDPGDTSGLSSALSDCIVSFDTSIENTCGLAMYYPWQFLTHYSNMLQVMSELGYPDSYLEFFNCFCSVLSIAENENPPEMQEQTEAPSAESGKSVDSFNDVPVSEYANLPWYREDVVKQYYPEASISSHEAVITQDAEDVYDSFYWIDLPEGVDWKNIWYREDRLLLDDGTRLINMGTAGYQDLYQEEEDFIVYDPVWYCIGNTVVPCYFQYFEERTDGIKNAIHYIPAVLNGRDRIQIIVHENRETRELTVPGYYNEDVLEEYDGIRVPPKASSSFKEGDVLQFPVDCYSYDYLYQGTELLPQKEVVEKDGPVVMRGYTGNRSAHVSASFRDIYNNFIYTPWAVHKKKGPSEHLALTGDDAAWVPSFAPGNDPKAVGVPYGLEMSFGFKIKNDSPNEIHGIYLNRAEYPDGFYQDILYETLPPGKCAFYADTWHYSEWDGPVWMMGIIDSEDRQNLEPAVFNPWAAKEIRISWNEAEGTYDTEVVYGREGSFEQDIEAFWSQSFLDGNTEVLSDAMVFLSGLPDWEFTIENRGNDVITHMYMGVCDEDLPEKMKEVSDGFTLDDFGGNDMILDLIPAQSSFDYRYPIFNEGNHPVWALAIGDDGMTLRDAKPMVPFPEWKIYFEDLSGRRSPEEIISPWDTDRIIIEEDEGTEGFDYRCEFQ